jgi:hypothetical protein
LRRVGRLLADQMLPNCVWIPLHACLTPRGLSLSPGRRPAGVAMELRPVAVATDANLLAADKVDWMNYVETAPEIRLHHLSFAYDAQSLQRVLIRGVPLPPLPGTRFVEAECIATPAGFQWHPPVSALSVRTALGAEELELIILWVDGSFTRVPRSAWNAAARSTVRLMLAPEKYA